jgi:hypothetical protein
VAGDDRFSGAGQGIELALGKGAGLRVGPDGTVEGAGEDGAVRDLVQEGGLQSGGIEGAIGESGIETGPAAAEDGHEGPFHEGGEAGAEQERIQGLEESIARAGEDLIIDRLSKLEPAVTL